MADLHGCGGEGEGTVVMHYEVLTQGQSRLLVAPGKQAQVKYHETPRKPK